MKQQQNDLIMETIFDSLTPQMLFDDLPLTHHKGGGSAKEYYSSNCPKCERNEFYIYPKGSTVGVPNVGRCSHLNSCNYVIAGWNYYRDRHDLTPHEMVIAASRLTGVKLENVDYDKIIQQKNKGMILEEIYRFCKEFLDTDPRSEKVRQIFIEQRNYDINILKNTEWGYYPSEKEIKIHLEKLGMDTSILNQVGLSNWQFGDIYNLCLPYRNINGFITGFLFRYHENVVPLEVLDRINSRSKKPRSDARWNSTWGLTKSCFFNHHRHKGVEDLLIVEGYPDAVYLEALGIPTIALGQGKISDPLIKYFNYQKNKRVTFCLDQEENAKKATLRAIELLKEKSNLDIYVLDLPDTKDPDEYVRKYGIENFITLFSNAQHYSKWAAKEIIRQNNPSNDKSNLSTIGDLLRFDQKVKDGFASDHIMRTITERFGYTEEALLEKKKELDAQKEESARKELANNVTKRVLEINNKSAPAELFKYIQETGKSSAILNATADIQAVPFNVVEAIEQITTIPETLSTGIDVIDTHVKLVPGGLIVLGARPRHGKTSTALNINLNMLENYPSKAFIYFSLEMLQWQLFLKMCCIKSNKYSYDQVLEFFKSGNLPKDLQMIKQQFMDDYSKRLYIKYDTSLSIDHLVTYANKVADHHGDLGCVFVDFLQLVKPASSIKEAGVRERQVAEVSLKLNSLSQSLNIPVVALATINREADKGSGEAPNKANTKPEEQAKKLRPKIHHLRESGQIESDASAIVGLFDIDAARQVEADSNYRSTSDGVVPLEFSILKNRYGQAGKIHVANFNKRTGKLFNK